MKYALLFSLTLHAALFSYKLRLLPGQGTRDEKGDGSGREQGMREEIVAPKQQQMKVEVREMTPSDREGIARMRKLAEEDAKKDECLASYDGIGIEHDDFLTKAVTLVVEGYPADKAGLRVGDKIIGYVDDDGTFKDGYKGLVKKGAANTKVILHIDRDNALIMLPVIRERICYKPKVIETIKWLP